MSYFRDSTAPKFADKIYIAFCIWCDTIWKVKL